MEWTSEKINEVYAQIKEKAAQDPAFREKFCKDPVKTVEEFTGLAVPAGYSIQVIEKGDGIDAVYTNGELLSDEELDQVAGGSCGANACAAQGTGVSLDK